MSTLASERNYKDVKSVIERTENPHPFVVILAFIVVIIIINLLFRLIECNVFEGVWMLDTDNRMFIFTRSKRHDLMLLHGDNGFIEIIRLTSEITFNGVCSKTFGMLLNCNEIVIFERDPYNFVGVLKRVR